MSLITVLIIIFIIIAVGLGGAIIIKVDETNKLLRAQIDYQKQRHSWKF